MTAFEDPALDEVQHLHCGCVIETDTMEVTTPCSDHEQEERQA